MTNRKRKLSHAGLSSLALVTAGFSGVALAIPANAQYQQEIGNNPGKCANGPAVRVSISGIKAGGGTLRVQLYRGTKADWLEKGRWLNRIEVPARAGSVNVCMPVPEAGTYGIAVRHDLNANGKTDLKEDGGGMSNNPSLNIFNLGKPSYTKTAFKVGNAPASIGIQMRYF